jgi:hypothetical protein
MPCQLSLLVTAQYQLLPARPSAVLKPNKGMHTYACCLLHMPTAHLASREVWQLLCVEVLHCVLGCCLCAVHDKTVPAGSTSAKAHVNDESSSTQCDFCFLLCQTSEAVQLSKVGEYVIQFKQNPGEVNKHTAHPLLRPSGFLGILSWYTCNRKRSQQQRT